LGTSLDYESQDSRDKGAWDPKTLLSPFYEKWSVPTPGFIVDDVWCGMVASLGFGEGATTEMIQFWTATLKAVYVGDEGRRKLKVALACLLDRDGLLRRIRDIACPVYWLQVGICRPALRGMDADWRRVLLTPHTVPRFLRNRSSCS